jgi:hypothetical protein
MFCEVQLIDIGASPALLVCAKLSDNGYGVQLVGFTEEEPMLAVPVLSALTWHPARGVGCNRYRYTT